MTNEALRSITNDGDMTTTATCLSCDQRNEAHGTPRRPGESQEQPRKRRRDAAHGAPPQPSGERLTEPQQQQQDRATQTEANGLLCRDEIPDEDQIESAVEEVMDTLAGTATGYGCATFLPHDGPWTEDSQRWHEGSPICRSCEDSSYPEACALLFSASTRTRSVAVYADQCRGCRGLYDGIRGFEDGYTEPEDIYSGHPLPLAASEWTQESDIVPPLMEPGKIWERPSFKNGRLCFPDGQAAELAAAAALAASARANTEVFKMRLALNPQMHAGRHGRQSGRTGGAKRHRHSRKGYAPANRHEHGQLGSGCRAFGGHRGSTPCRTPVARYNCRPSFASEHEPHRDRNPADGPCNYGRNIPIH